MPALSVRLRSVSLTVAAFGIACVVAACSAPSSSDDSLPDDLDAEQAESAWTCTYTCSRYRYAVGQCWAGWRCESNGCLRPATCGQSSSGGSSGVSSRSWTCTYEGVRDDTAVVQSLTSAEALVLTKNECFAKGFADCLTWTCTNLMNGSFQCGYRGRTPTKSYTTSAFTSQEAAAKTQQECARNNLSCPYQSCS